MGFTLTRRVAEHVPMLIFAVVNGPGRRRPCCANAPSPHAGDRCHLWRWTGFLGGGGFLIIPVLILRAHIESRKAVGASLAVIAINCFAGLLGHLRYGVVDVAAALQFLGLVIVGTLAGGDGWLHGCLR